MGNPLRWRRKPPPVAAGSIRTSSAWDADLRGFGRRRRASGRRSPLAGGQIAEQVVADRYPYQPQRRQADGGRHPADLAIASLAQRQLDPRGGNELAETHRWFARPQP